MKFFYTLLFFLVIINSSYTQEDDFAFVSKMKINQKKIIRSTEIKDETVYLGFVKDSKGKLLYHVIAQYSFVYSSLHGFSNIYCLDLNYREIDHYELSGREELPFKLTDNKLYFKYINEKGNKEIFVFKLTGLKPPKIICVAPENCY